MKHDVWVQDGDNLYYFRNWGAALNIGWKQMDGDWYYFDQETAPLTQARSGKWITMYTDLMKTEKCSMTAG